MVNNDMSNVWNLLDAISIRKTGLTRFFSKKKRAVVTEVSEADSPLFFGKKKG